MQTTDWTVSLLVKEVLTDCRMLVLKTCFDKPRVIKVAGNPAGGILEMKTR